MGETDHPLKRLVALAPEDFAAWLLNRPIRSVTTRQGELTATPDPIDTDLVLFVVAEDDSEVILHIEFQGPSTERPMSLRMLDYRTRLALTNRGYRIQGVVIYLDGAGARDTGHHQIMDAYGRPGLSWSYTVIRLWQLRAEDLLALQRPALLPLLGQTTITNPAETIPQALAQIEQHTSGEQRERLLTELLLLCRDAEVATMVEQMITQTYGLPETPMMRKLREEGREEGQEQMLLRQLTHRYGLLDSATITKIQQLHGTQLLLLAEALLDFHNHTDLIQWLDDHNNVGAA